jgi:hypothetical protein
MRNLIHYILLCELFYRCADLQLVNVKLEFSKPTMKHKPVCVLYCTDMLQCAVLYRYVTVCCIVQICYSVLYCTDMLQCAVLYMTVTICFFYRAAQLH